MRFFLKTEACPNTLCGLQMTRSADIATNVKPNLTVFQSTDIRGAQNKALFFFSVKIQAKHIFLQVSFLGTNELFQLN